MKEVRRRETVNEKKEKKTLKRKENEKLKENEKDMFWIKKIELDIRGKKKEKQ